MNFTAAIHVNGLEKRFGKVHAQIFPFIPLFMLPSIFLSGLILLVVAGATLKQRD